MVNDSFRRRTAKVTFSTIPTDGRNGAIVGSSNYIVDKTTRKSSRRLLLVLLLIAIVLHVSERPTKITPVE